MNVDAHLDQAIEQSELGLLAEKFIDSPIGIALIERADREVEDSLKELADVEPTNTERIRQLQNAVWRARSFAAWLQEIVERGQEATSLLKEYVREAA